MRVVIQRVSEASVTIDGKLKSSIHQGLLILAGFQSDDTDDDLDWTCKKIIQLRIFDDEKGRSDSPRIAKQLHYELSYVSPKTFEAKKSLS